MMIEGKRAKRFLCVASIVLMPITGCGGSASSALPQPVTPVSPSATITLTAFSEPVPAGSPGFTATANGSNFTAASVVLWNGAQLATSYQTSTILFASVPAALLTTPGSASITVTDPKTGAKSNSLPTAILSPAAASAAVVQLVSAESDGNPSNGDSLVQPSISATGRFVAFQSAGTALTQKQVITPWQNIYLRDTCVGATTPCSPSTEIVSVSADGMTGGNFQSRNSTVSADGRYIAFDSGASNLVSGTSSYCNSSTNCVYLRDTCLGVVAGCTPRTTVASILPGEVPSGGGQPQITASGRYITFDSNGNGSVQVYLRDLCIGAPSGCVPKTVLISANAQGQAANVGANPQALSSDGSSVGFVSYSTNLLNPGQSVAQSISGLYLSTSCSTVSRNCVSGVTKVDTPNPGGQANAGLDYEAIPSLSGDGRYVAYASDATNLVDQNVQGFGNVYVRDTCLGASNCTNQNLLVSVGNDGSIGNAGSHQQSMSADGRYVAFTSIATNLTWGTSFAAGTWQDVYVRDTCTGAPAACAPSTVRVAVTIAPALQTLSSAGASLPAISADGHYVVFLSTAANLNAAGGNGHSQVFLARTGF